MTEFNILPVDKSKELFNPGTINAYEPERDIVADVRNSFGGTDRRIDQRRSVRNTETSGVYLTANTSIPDGTTRTTISGSTNRASYGEYLTNQWASPSAGKITFPTNGVYLINASVQFNSATYVNTTLTGIRLLRTGGEQFFQYNFIPSGTYTNQIHICIQQDFLKGLEMECQVIQVSGGAITAFLQMRVALLTKLT